MKFIRINQSISLFFFELIIVFQPDVVIHAAAERRTDVVENEPEAVQQLNVVATGVIAEICGRLIRRPI